MTIGFKSITVTEENYLKFETHYNKLKKLGRIPFGVNSFAGYVAYLMETYNQEKESLQKLASKIKTVPAKFTEQKLTIKI